VACQASLSGMGGISREEYRRLLTNIGCHTLLEHYISTAIAANSPENLVLPETPVTQAAAPPPHLALTGAASGANPSGQPTCKGGNKTTIET